MKTVFIVARKVQGVYLNYQFIEADNNAQAVELYEYQNEWEGSEVLAQKTERGDMTILNKDVITVSHWDQLSVYQFKQEHVG